MEALSNAWGAAHSLKSLMLLVEIFGNLDWNLEIFAKIRGVHHGASWCMRFRNPLNFTWISDFRLDFCISCGFLDFWISKWISVFQSGFQYFKVDSGFQSKFLDFKLDFWIIFKVDSGFCLKNYYLLFWRYCSWTMTSSQPRCTQNVTDTS